MGKKVPQHIADLYERGAHGFRSKKRQQAREVLRALQALQPGCSWFPDGGHEAFSEMNRLATLLVKTLSVKNWGK